MTQEYKKPLPYILYGYTTKLYSLFFKKLVLMDDEKLESRHLRHYDIQCEGVQNIIDFTTRKRKRLIIEAFMNLKAFKEEVEYEEQQMGHVNFESFNQGQKKQKSTPQVHQIKTARTKYFTRANTSVEESDNSFIFTPNAKKNYNQNKKQYYSSTLTQVGSRNSILQNLLHRVKKINHESYQQSLKPAKSSYFNLTLGKQSLQTFHNNCNCNCSCHNYTPSYKKQNKQMKRRKILQKFQKIQRKIYDTQPQYGGFFAGQYGGSTKLRQHIAYSTYEPLTFHQRPDQILFTTPRGKHQKMNLYNCNPLSASKSVSQINQVKKVYI